MKILKDNYVGHVKAVKVKEKKIVKPYPRQMVCEYCKSTLEYEESDLYMGSFGHMHLDCPCCGYDNMLDEHEDNIVLTKDNIQFPTHFHHCCTENGAVDCCNNEEVRKVINKGIEYFRKNKNEYAWSHSSGNLCIHISRWEGDKVYDVMVTNNHYSMDIPFEKVDY